MIRVLLRSVGHVVRAVSYTLVGALVVVVAAAIVYLEGRPDLKVWHTVELDEEFTKDASVETFAHYLALEERLFRQLDDEVYAQIDDADRREINRYHSGSRTDPTVGSINWNRSFELPVDAPRVGVALIHGLSDSPYSLRHLGQRLHEDGAWVLGLRVPGHGTAPSGLVHAEWPDWAAAVRLAMRHLREQVPDRPLAIIGYSNGGALAVLYALESLEDPSLPRSEQLILLSPEIGITKLASLASVQELLGHLLGLEKLAWNSVLPEYDPYKYGSFALNAGKQAYRLTAEIQSRITRLGEGGALSAFPPTLAFQSVADTTVSAPVLVSGLFDRLPAGGHELVLFDINRFTEIEPLLTDDPESWLDSILRDAGNDFAITVLSNESEDRGAVVVHHREAGSSDVTTVPSGLSWPANIYSLSHVALPIPHDDAHYGGPDAKESPGLPLGDLALRGEHGVLQISAGGMLRLRWNPFYPYIEARAVEVVDGLITKSP